MFNKQAKEIIKKLYSNLDMDFVIEKTEELYKLENGQTFENYKMASDYTYNLLEKEGFEPVRYTFKADGKATYQDKRMPIAWKATKGKLTILSPNTAFADPVIADFEKTSYALIKHSVSTPEGGIRTKIVTERQVWAGEDCTGAMVLIDGRAGNISKFLDLGALGVISDYLTNADAHPDDTYWANACTDDDGHWHVQSEDRDFIGFQVTPRIGKKLRAVCEAGAVTALVECDGVRYEGEIDAVTATLKGKSNKEFWLLAHLYEPTPSDNSLGVVGAISIIKAIRELVKKGELPEPDYTIRVLFAMEVYGFAALYESLGEEITNNVLGGLNIDGLLEKDKTSYTIVYPPYSSPFYAKTFIKSAFEVYGDLFPNTEDVNKELICFTDDDFLGDSTTKVPTIWVFHAITKGETQHNTCVTMDWLDKAQVARNLAVIAFGATASVCKVIPIEDMLENALRLANKELERRKEINSSEAYMSYFRRGEKQIILDFKKISDSPLVEEYANKIDDTYVEFKGEDLGIWQNYAKTLIVKRETKGFPFDKIRAPKNERKSLPNSVIYGPFGLVLSAMDGKKDLEQIIREVYWEASKVLPSETIFKQFISAIFYLADYGYVSVKESYVLTKDDLKKALKELGLKKSDLVMVHSAFSRCGHLQGGVDAYIDAFLESAETVLTPSFTRPYIAFEGSINKNPPFLPFDKNSSDGIWTGAVPTNMLKRGAVRSAHATHSWCGLGPRAKECVADHGLLDPPTGETSPFTYALKNNGKIITYGVDVNSLTFLHYLEDQSGAEFLANAVVKVKNDNGKLSTHVIPRHLPGCRGFYGAKGLESKFMRKVMEKGFVYNSVDFGLGKIYMFDMKELYEKGMEVFKEDKNATLCERPDCQFCRKFD